MNIWIGVALVVLVSLLCWLDHRLDRALAEYEDESQEES